MNNRQITADGKDNLECPACGIKTWADEQGRREMEAHKAECHGYEVARERFDKGDRVTYSDFGKLRLTHKRNLDRIGTVVGFGRTDNAVRVHWDGNKETTTDRYEHRFIKHVEDDDHP